MADAAFGDGDAEAQQRVAQLAVECLVGLIGANFEDAQAEGFQQGEPVIDGERLQHFSDYRKGLETVRLETISL